MAAAALIQGATRAVSIVASNPTVRAKVAEYYKKATGKTVDFANVAQVTDVVSRGPAPASVVLRAAVSAGVNPNDIFEGIVLNEQRDRAASAIVDQLRVLYSGISKTLDDRSVIHSAGNLGAQLFNKEVIVFARRQFGSTQAIREAHAKFRAFMAMDSQTLEETLALHA